jgi:hypothetical protein
MAQWLQAFRLRQTLSLSTGKLQLRQTLSLTGWSRPFRPAVKLPKRAALAAEVWGRDRIEMKDVLSCKDILPGLWRESA